MPAAHLRTSGVRVNAGTCAPLWRRAGEGVISADGGSARFRHYLFALWMFYASVCLCLLGFAQRCVACIAATIMFCGFLAGSSPLVPRLPVICLHRFRAVSAFCVSSPLHPHYLSSFYLATIAGSSHTHTPRTLHGFRLDFHAVLLSLHAPLPAAWPCGGSRCRCYLHRTPA